MNLRRTWGLSKKNLKEFRRDKGRLFFTIFLPLMFLLMFGVAFGGNNTTTYNVGVVNMGTTEIDGQCAEQFIGNLTYGGVMQVKDYGSDNVTALEDLKGGKLSGVLIIPSNFGESILSFRMSPSNSSQWINSSILLYADGGSMFASQTIPPLVNQAIARTAIGSQANSASLPVNVLSPTLVSVEGLRYLDALVPGIMTFAILMTMDMTATVFLEEKQKGLTRRIRTTPVTTSDISAAVTITMMITAVFQVAVMFGASSFIGYNPRGGAYGLVSGFVVAVLFAVLCVGIGLIIGTVSKSAAAASVMSWVVLMPMMFFSGLWVPREMLPSQVQPISNIMPATYVADALTSLLSRGAAITAPTVIMSIVGITIFTAVIYVVGTLVFRRTAANF